MNRAAPVSVVYSWVLVVSVDSNLLYQFYMTV